MAFINPKYELIFNDVYQGTSGTIDVYRAQIYKDGYSSGTIYPITGTDSPITIETIDTEGNAYTPIMSSRLTLNILKNYNQATNYFDLLNEFFSADDNDFMIVISKGTYNYSTYTWTSTIWRGFFLPVDSIQYTAVGTNEFSLTFVDGLSRTKNKKYYFSTTDGIGYFPDEKISIKDLLVECLSETEFTLDIWINEYYKTANVDSRNIENMYLKKNYLMEQYGEYLSYYNILEYLCNRFAWECYYKDDKWYLTCYGALTRETSISYYVYNSSGTYQSTQSVGNTTSVAIDGSNNFKQIGESLMISFNRAQKSYTQFSPIYNVKQLVSNGWFLSWSGTNNVDAWIETGMVVSKYDPNSGGLYTDDLTTNSAETNKAIRSFNNTVKAGDYLTLAWSDYTFDCTARYWVRILPDDNSGAQYMDNTGTFSTTVYYLNTYPVSFPKQVLVPIDGSIDFVILRPLQINPGGFLELYYFICQNVGPSSQIYNYDSYREIGSKNSEFKPEQTDNYSLGFMYNDVFKNNDSGARAANQPDDVSASSYVGMYTDSLNGGFANQFGRNGSGSTEIFTLVVEDIGIDQVQNQIVIDGQFKSIGYSLNSRFTYSYDNVNTYTYLLKSYRWNLKQAIQESILKKINYSGTTINIDVFKNINTRK
jgi:hypothetical protein